MTAGLNSFQDLWCHWIQKMRLKRSVGNSLPNCGTMVEFLKIIRRLFPRSGKLPLLL